MCGHYLNPSTSAFAHSIRNSSPGRVNHGDEANKAEIIHREIHFIGVKLEPFRKLFIRQIKVAETCKECRKPMRTSSVTSNEDNIGYCPPCYLLMGI
jgi:hypothetical protein